MKKNNAGIWNIFKGKIITLPWAYWDKLGLVKNLRICNNRMENGKPCGVALGYSVNVNPKLPNFFSLIIFFIYLGTNVNTFKSIHERVQAGLPTLMGKWTVSEKNQDCDGSS